MPQYIRPFIPGGTFFFTVREHVSRDERDYKRHTHYIHYNPVKHGHVARAAEWPYSSFHRYVERGIYNLEWAAEDNVRRLEME